jgi:hypothetical protein
MRVQIEPHADLRASPPNSLSGRALEITTCISDYSTWFFGEPSEPLFDHLVGDGEQAGRERQAERAGSRPVEDEVKLVHLQNR